MTLINIITARCPTTQDILKGNMENRKTYIYNEENELSKVWRRISFTKLYIYVMYVCIRVLMSSMF